jgi:Spy/CpxP family protein refolding chaperone
MTTPVGATRSKLWVVVALVTTFAAGVVVDWGLRTWAGAHGGGLWGRGRRHGPDAVVPYLARKLALSAAQRDSVHAIFERHRCDMVTLWRATRPRFDSLRAAIDAEIEAQLSPAQREQFHALAPRRERPRPGPGGGAMCPSSAGPERH